MPYFKWKKAVLKPRSPPPPLWHQLPCNHGLAAMAALPLRKKSGPEGGGGGPEKENLNPDLEQGSRAPSAPSRTRGGAGRAGP